MYGDGRNANGRGVAGKCYYMFPTSNDRRSRTGVTTVMGNYLLITLFEVIILNMVIWLVALLVIFDADQRNLAQAVDSQRAYFKHKLWFRKWKTGIILGCVRPYKEEKENS